MTLLDSFFLSSMVTCLALLLYVYAGYGWLLQILAPKTDSAHSNTDSALPDLTVLLTVFNEEAKLARRLDNLLEQDYPKGQLRILVASDGSTDESEKIVEAYAAKDDRITLIRSGGRLGKSGTQNLAISQIDAGIVALTDADTHFEPGYLKAIGRAFGDPRVGCVTANLLFEDQGGGISRNQGRYWNYELKLRRLESRLDILAVASGQAMAFRRELFVDLPLNVGDDCIIPLDVALAGFQVRYCGDAVALDVMENQSQRELNTRIRMTLRNWVGTWLRPQLLNPLRHPGYAFSLWSHKLLRWLGGPAFWLLLANALWVGIRTDPTHIVAAGALLALAAILIGWRLEGREHQIPVVNSLFSFALANLGFTLGLWRVLQGQQVVVYQSGVDVKHVHDSNQ